MNKLYIKSEISFALVWIGLYVVVMNIALQFCGGFDNLAGKTAAQVLIPVICISALAVAVTAWTVKNGLAEKFGLCRFKGNAKSFLYFIPLLAMSCINLKNGLWLPAALPVALLMMVNMAIAGYVEEIIFRGFLFRAMEKDSLPTAIIVSAVTFSIMSTDCSVTTEIRTNMSDLMIADLMMRIPLHQKGITLSSLRDMALIKRPGPTSQKNTTRARSILRCPLLKLCSQIVNLKSLA